MQAPIQSMGEKEVGDLFNAVALVIKEVKSGKGIPEMVADVLPALVQCIKEASAAVADVSSDPAGSARSAACGAVDCVMALK
jgi:hypothetical protein